MTVPVDRCPRCLCGNCGGRLDQHTEGGCTCEDCGLSWMRGCRLGAFEPSEGIGYFAEQLAPPCPRTSTRPPGCAASRSLTPHTTPCATTTSRRKPTVPDASSAARFAAAYAALTASHEVADHWVQVDSCAVAKGDPGPKGAAACAKHVASYTATQAATLLAADRLLGLGLTWRRTTAALAVSAITHYVADRQAGHWRDEHPRGVAWLAAVTGHRGWLARDPGSPYLMDQAWHKGWILVAAVVAAGGGDRA